MVNPGGLRVTRFRDRASEAACNAPAHHVNQMIRNLVTEPIGASRRAPDDKERQVAVFL